MPSSEITPRSVTSSLESVLNLLRIKGNPPLKGVIEYSESAKLKEHLLHVIGRNINGKLIPSSTVADGISSLITPSTFANLDFNDHGPDNLNISPLILPEEVKHRMPPRYISYADSLWSVVHSFQSSLPEEIKSTHLVSLSPSSKRGHSIITVFLFQNAAHVDRRYPSSAMRWQFEMQKGHTKSLLDDIKADPNLLEELFQSLFPGLDASQENLLGLYRFPSSGIKIINESVFTKKIIKDLFLAEFYGNWQDIVATQNSVIENIKEFWNSQATYDYKEKVPREPNWKRPPIANFPNR